MEVCVDRQRRRQRCSSLHSLLRRQLNLQRTKMAAAFRKLFRSAEKPEGQYPAARAPTACKTSGRDQPGGAGAKGQNVTPRGQGPASRGQNPSSGRSQASGAWSQGGGTGGEVLAVGGAGHNGLNSPSTARRFFSRHTYLEGSRVGPAEGIVPQHSPKSTSRSKNQPTSTAPSASPSSGGLFKKSPPGGILNESTSKHMKVVRTRRLMKEYQELSRVQQSLKDPVFTVDLVNDCLYEWKVSVPHDPALSCSPTTPP